MMHKDLSTDNVIQVYILHHTTPPNMIKYNLMTGESNKFLPPPTKVSCKQPCALLLFSAVKILRMIFVTIFHNKTKILPTDNSKERT